MKSVLVTGTTFPSLPHWLPLYAATRRAAYMVGATLAKGGFGLVTGNTPGVDSVAAAAFCAEVERAGGDPDDGYRQLWLPHWKRGYWLPGSAYPAAPASLIRLHDFDDWIEEAITQAAAAVMIGGRGGAGYIARRFMDAGKPVFPVPFTGGQSTIVFQDILRTWCDAPVPGLTRNQFLQLALPWTSGTGALTRLLLGTLTEQPEIFISYRRSDTGLAAGRLHTDLQEHFGSQQVFMDLKHIEPSDTWQDSIRQALDGCRVGVVLIGRGWLAGAAASSRLRDEHDVLRQEVEALLARRKAVLPVLVDGASLPPAEALPESLLGLLRLQASAIDNGNWAMVVADMLRKIEQLLAVRRPSDPPESR